MWTKTNLFPSSWVSTVSFLSFDSKFCLVVVWVNSICFPLTQTCFNMISLLFFWKRDNPFSLECLYLLGLALLAKKMFLIDFWWNSNESCHFIWFHSSSIFIYKINELVMSCQFSVSASFTVMLPRGGHGDNNDFYARNCLDLFHRIGTTNQNKGRPICITQNHFPHIPLRGI